MTASRRILPYVVLTPLVVFAMFPLLWMIATSLKRYADVYTFPPVYLPGALSLEFYAKVLEDTAILRNMLNSLIISSASTVLSVTFGAMAGWVFARARFRGSHLLMRSVVVAYLLPQILIVIPLFVFLHRIGLTNTYAGLILAYVTLTFPFSTWLLTDYMRSIPYEIEEQGRIDGAGNFVIFTRLVLPLAWPGLATAAIFAFINSWNEFLYALVILGSGQKQVLTTGLYNLVGGENAQWGPMMAATTITMLPTLLLFLIVQRRLVSGMTMGSVK